MSVPARLRFKILQRDGCACRYCGRCSPDVTLHVDHVRAKSRGGKNTWANLVTACSDCNLGKSNIGLPGEIEDRLIDENERCITFCTYCEEMIVLTFLEMSGVKPGLRWHHKTCKDAAVALEPGTRRSAYAEETPIDEIDLEIAAWDELAAAAGL